MRVQQDSCVRVHFRRVNDSNRCFIVLQAEVNIHHALHCYISYQEVHIDQIKCLPTRTLKLNTIKRDRSIEQIYFIGKVIMTGDEMNTFV